MHHELREKLNELQVFLHESRNDDGYNKFDAEQFKIISKSFIFLFYQNRMFSERLIIIPIGRLVLPWFHL